MAALLRVYIVSPKEATTIAPKRGTAHGEYSFLIGSVPVSDDGMVSVLVALVCCLNCDSEKRKGKTAEYSVVEQQLERFTTDSKNTFFFLDQKNSKESIVRTLPTLTLCECKGGNLR